LNRCCEFIRTIGSLQFATKEKKIVLAADFAVRRAPTRAMSPPRAVTKPPLSMTTRSADVDLFSSSSVKLLPVSTAQDPSAASRKDPVIDEDSAQVTSKMSSDEDNSGDNGSGSDHGSPKGVRAKKITPKAAAAVGSEEGIVTAKSSDALLGHVMRHVERSMTNFARNLLSRRNETASDRLVSARSYPPQVTSKHSNASESYTSTPQGTLEKGPMEPKQCTVSTGEQTMAQQICRCVFSLFEESPGLPGALSSSNHSQRGVIGSAGCDVSGSTVNDLSVSELLTEGGQGRNEAPCGAAVCNTSSSDRTLSNTTTAVVRQLLLQNVSERRKCQALSMAAQYMYQCNRDCSNLLKRLLTVSKDRMQLSKSTRTSSIGNDGRKRRRGESGYCNSKYDRVGLGRRRKGCTLSDIEDEEEEEEEILSLNEEDDETRNEGRPGTTESRRASPAPHTPLSGPNVSSVPPEHFYSFLEALLAVVSPSAVIGAKEWILRKSTQDPQIERTAQQSSKGPSKRRRSQNLKSERGCTAAGVASDKQAHSLIFKIEEFEWRLLSVLQELDRQQKCTPGRHRRVSV
jgi:hypothetical protein